jgi:demethylmenaquinone methyltransferase/2-methoxy-6-polyprenyl-1,4-benzoquinol methylase
MWEYLCRGLSVFYTKHPDMNSLLRWRINQKEGFQMKGSLAIEDEERRSLQFKYDITAWFYDILDYPWERQYRHWRPQFLEDVHGEVIEAGVGTGRNLKYYNSDVNLIAIDLCKAMVKIAKKRGRSAVCRLDCRQEDATKMPSISSNHFDWIISTFLCCVLPYNLQILAIKQFERVLKPGGKIRLLEMVYSKVPKFRRRQNFFAPFVEKVYGARFDRNVLENLQEYSRLRITNTYFLKRDIYQVIEGYLAE